MNKENYLIKLEKQMIIVSHDEEFLNNVTNKIFELENGKITEYNLSYSDYLNYSDVETAEEGINSVYSFLNGWFIEKCMWATTYTTKEEAASIKKFYAYMSEKGYVEKEDYVSLCRILKDNMDEILDNLEALDNGTYYDMF